MKRVACLLVAMMVGFTTTSLQAKAGPLITEPLRDFIGFQELFGADILRLKACLDDNNVGLVPFQKMGTACRSDFMFVSSVLQEYGECIDNLLSSRDIPKLMYPYGDLSLLSYLRLRVQIAEALAVDLGMKDRITSDCIEPIKRKHAE